MDLFRPDDFAARAHAVRDDSVQFAAATQQAARLSTKSGLPAIPSERPLFVCAAVAGDETTNVEFTRQKLAALDEAIRTDAERQIAAKFYPANGWVLDSVESIAKGRISSEHKLERAVKISLHRTQALYKEATPDEGERLLAPEPEFVEAKKSADDLFPSVAASWPQTPRLYEVAKPAWETVKCVVTVHAHEEAMGWMLDELAWEQADVATKNAEIGLAASEVAGENIVFRDAPPGLPPVSDWLRRQQEAIAAVRAEENKMRAAPPLFTEETLAKALAAPVKMSSQTIDRFESPTAAFSSGQPKGWEANSSQLASQISVSFRTPSMTEAGINGDSINIYYSLSPDTRGRLNLGIIAPIGKKSTWTTDGYYRNETADLRRDSRLISMIDRVPVKVAGEEALGFYAVVRNPDGHVMIKIGAMFVLNGYDYGIHLTSRVETFPEALEAFRAVLASYQIKTQ